MTDYVVPWMDVTRVHTERGSHIEPEFDPDWPERVKLEWHAAVTAHDTGLRVEVFNAQLWVDDVKQEGLYCIAVGSSSASAFTYREAWTYLNGISTGAWAKEKALEQVEHGCRCYPA